MNSTRQPKLFLSCVRPNRLVLRVLRIKKLECSSRMNDLFFNREVSLNPTDKIMQNFRSFVVGTSSIRVLPQTPHHPKKRQYIFTTHFCFFHPLDLTRAHSVRPTTHVVVCFCKISSIVFRRWTGVCSGKKKTRLAILVIRLPPS